MKQGIIIACLMVVITGDLFLESALGEEKVSDQKFFATADAAVEALGKAYEGSDLKSVARILGDEGMKLVYSGDLVIDDYEHAWFIALYREEHEVVFENDDRAVLNLGREEYPYPIPIVNKGKGWHFDPREGHEDLLSRRISKTELSALDVVVAYVEAQRAYSRHDHDGDGVLEYARKFSSTPNQRDGLYWEERPGEEPSPMAALVDVVHKEGYKSTGEGRPALYRGYFFKILKAQGVHAPGGARDYVINGKMTGGFGLTAFPVRYGISGVLTFIVNQDGVVYQKDLGPDTVALGKKMMLFDPDGTWTQGGN